MIRITFVELVLVATPFLLYFLYRAVVGARRSETGEAIDETPYQILFLAGSAVALASLVVVVLLRPEDDPRSARTRDQIYIPPQVVDGEVRPGHFISREEAIAQGLVEDLPADRDFDPDTPDAGGAAPDDDSPEASSP